MGILATYLTFALVGPTFSDAYAFLKSCDAPYIERSIPTTPPPMYYYRDYDRRYHHDDPCDHGLGVIVDVTCDLMSHIKNMKYTLEQKICPRDHVRFFTLPGTHMSVLPGSAFAADFEISELH
nr:unnamed protein product [Callosobruchus analis]